MKSFIPFILAMLISLVSCGPLQGDYPLGTPRNLTQGNGNVRSGRGSSNPKEDTPLTEGRDTTLYISALSFGSDYDWRRDSACGNVNARLLLYRNTELIMDIPAGTGHTAIAEPDMHHILDGHIYSEYSTASQTVISRDGKELFRFSGREYLKGILVNGGNLYTLSQNRSGEGFSLRINGEVMTMQQTGILFGDLSDPSYGPNGSLYMDEGRMAYSYRIRKGNSYRYFSVQNGHEEEVMATGRVLYDIKVVGGTSRFARNADFGYEWADARVWRDGSISGEISPIGTGHVVHTGIFMSQSSRVKIFGFRDGLIYRDGNNALGLDRKSLAKESCYLSGSCAVAAGNHLIVAINPRNPGECPRVRNGSREWKIEGINGYITGLSLEVSPAR